MDKQVMEESEESIEDMVTHAEKGLDEKFKNHAETGIVIDTMIVMATVPITRLPIASTTAPVTAPTTAPT